MDDITNKRFENLDKKIDAVEERLTAKIDNLDTKVDDLDTKVDDLDTKVEAGIHGLRRDISLGFAEAGEERRKFHAEQMGRFQMVTGQAEKLGAQLGKLEERAESERDRKIAELQSDLAAMQTNFRRLEEMFLKVLGGETKS